VHEDFLNVELAPPDVFQRLCSVIKKPLRTDDYRFIEAFLEDARVSIEINSKNNGSELRISYNFERYWLSLLIIMPILVILFLAFDKATTGEYDPMSILIPFILLFGWIAFKDWDEQKKKEKIRKKIMETLEREK